MKLVVCFCVHVLVGLGVSSPGNAQLLDTDWTSNAILDDCRPLTITEIGAGQGVAIVHQKLYFYGDRYSAKPRMGVIREFSMGLKSTGRTLLLTENGVPRLTHPTGIAYLDRNHVLIGDTVNQKALIYCVDWARAWRDGNLDHAIKHVIKDDLAVNGCRPVTVGMNGKRYIATADYGNSEKQVRVYDAEKLLTAKSTSEPGVLFGKFRCGPYNQNLDWNPETGQLVCIQNVTPGRGWRLQWIDLADALKTGNGLSGSSLKRTITLPPHTELEGFRTLPSGEALFLTAHATRNVWIGKIKPHEKIVSRAGYQLPYFND